MLQVGMLSSLGRWQLSRPVRLPKHTSLLPRVVFNTWEHRYCVVYKPYGWSMRNDGTALGRPSLETTCRSEGVTSHRSRVDCTSLIFGYFPRKFFPLMIRVCHIAEVLLEFFIIDEWRIKLNEDSRRSMNPPTANVVGYRRLEFRAIILPQYHTCGITLHNSAINIFPIDSISLKWYAIPNTTRLIMGSKFDRIALASSGTLSTVTYSLSCSPTSLAYAYVFEAFNHTEYSWSAELLFSSLLRRREKISPQFFAANKNHFSHNWLDSYPVLARQLEPRDPLRSKRGARSHEAGPSITWRDWPTTGSIEGRQIVSQ